MPRVDPIQIRSDTAANWTATNPMLLNGEIGLETDTGKAKIGNGAATWSTLAYRITPQTHTASRPTNPTPGEHWVDPATGEIDIYVSDGTSSYWLQISGN